MSKQKLAELVLQKMQQKKQRQQRNRPHREVLQLLVKFQVEDYDRLQIQITELQKQIKIEQETLDNLQSQCQDFENTGKKIYPRIIVKPQFLATQHVESLFKQFYRKSSNTFLREDILRKKQYDFDLEKFQEIQKTYSQILNKQNRIAKLKQIQHKNINQKRVRNLKQDLRLRSIRQQQQNIKRTIQEQKNSHKSLLDQYELKKTNLHKRVTWSEQLIKLIQDQKKLIQKTYNPVTYRDYLKKIFNLRTKNQNIHRCLIQAHKKVQDSEVDTQMKAQFLQKHDNLFIQGKCTDSPSKKKRYSLGSFQKQKKIKPKHNSLLFKIKKNIGLQQLNFQTPQKSMFKTKSISTSIGKTTASSMSNLVKGSSRRSESGFSDLKKSRQLKKFGQTVF